MTMKIRVLRMKNLSGVYFGEEKKVGKGWGGRDGGKGVENCENKRKSTKIDENQ